MQQRHYYYSPFLLCLTLLLLAVLCDPVKVRGGEESKKTVAFLPFQTHAEKDLGHLRDGMRDMLASRLSAIAGVSIVDKGRTATAASALKSEFTMGQAAEIGKKLKADYIVTGSITSLGESYSIDAKVFNTAGSGAEESFFATAAREEEVIGAVNNLALDIGERVFGKTRPQPVSPAASGAVPAPSPYQTAHPEKVFIKQSRGRLSDSIFLKPNPISGSYEFTKSQNFSFAMQAMDTGDVDGDGLDEIVVASNNEVHVFRQGGERLVLFFKIPIIDRYKIHHLSVADLNGNGMHEIYISAADRDSPHSYALEWNGSEFIYLFKDERWYVRAMHIPNRGNVLVGQKADVTAPVLPGVFILEHEGTSLRKGEAVALPSYLNLFDFVLGDIDGDLRSEIIAINQSDRILVLSPQGSVMWISDDHYGGSTRYIGEDFYMENPHKDNLVIGMEKGENRIYIPARIVLADLDDDAKMEVIVNKNLSTASRIFQNYRRYPSGEVHALRWDGIGLTEVWRTKKIDGYIADYQFKIADEKTRGQLFVGLEMKGSGLDFFSGKSTILTFNLDLRNEE